MITITQALKDVLAQRPYIQELMNEGLINTSALARKLKPEVEQSTMKEVTEEAILMALRRLPQTFHAPNLTELFTSSAELTVRSNLVEITVHNADFTYGIHMQLLAKMESKPNQYLIITEGTAQTTIIGSVEIEPVVASLIDPQRYLAHFKKLSSLSIKLPEAVVTTTGVYYFILKLLAWENINVIEVASTYTELTIIVESKEAERAFSILNKALQH